MKNPHFLKFFSLTLLVISLSNCASHFSYVKDVKNKIPKNPKFYVRNVYVYSNDVKFLPLNKEAQPADLLNISEISEVTKNEIVRYLKSKNINSEDGAKEDVVTCDFAINYSNLFFALTSNKYARTDLTGYKIVVSRQNNEIIATRNDNNVYGASGLAIGWDAIVRYFAFKANKGDQKKSIEIFSRAIASDLEKFGK